MHNKPPLDSLLHYGTKRKSGRYAWGSGEDPRQGDSSYQFTKEVDAYRAKGLNDTEIANKMGMTTTQLRNGITWAKRERDEYNRKQVKVLVESGMSNVAIGKKLGISEATVRNFKKSSENVKKQQKMELDQVYDAIKDGVDKTGYLDVGVGVERQLGISRTKFNAVVNKLAKDEGYNIHYVGVARLSDPTGTKRTTVKVLTKDSDLTNTIKSSHKIATLQTQIDTNGKISNIGPPLHINLDRIKVRYAEQGGEAKDGLIELRPGTKDLDLGNSRYAQVRIAAGKDLFLKGMAAYGNKTDFPDGVDIIFNTNKDGTIPKDKVLKKMKEDFDNPFGANIVKQKGALNIVNEEGDWAKWSKTMSSQFLSKQPLKLIDDRLNDTYLNLKNEFDEINSMTNPVVKKHLMDKYIEGLDSKAKHLKAKGLPGTMSHVILPFPDMNPNEVFAPNYNNGDRVVLVRHPHGGVFEIPDLIVNNKSATALKMLGNDSPDAIGIHPSVAQKLSGADFDGDTALVIPNRHGQIKTSRTLKELKGWDTEMMTRYKRDYVTMTPEEKQTQMGIVSNLITDMTIKGASHGEIANAVKHSMVVIDAEKHKLDYKQSERDNRIQALIKEYQTHMHPDKGKISRGASTIISRSKKKIDISQPDTVRELNRNKVGKDGTILKKGMSPSEIAKKLEISESSVIDYLNGGDFDPGKYSSGRAKEELYVGYIKGVMKTKKDATKVSDSIQSPPRNKEAAKIYDAEVKSIDAKLNVALLNAPRERQAQVLTNYLYYSNLKPGMDRDDKKKLKKRSLARARDTVGAKKSMIKLTDDEWEAIQARAISPTKLKQVLNNADMDIVRKLASPRKIQLSNTKVSRAQQLLSKGYTYSEVAQVMGVTTTVLREEISR